MSDTTAANCKLCGQPMKATDLVERLKAENVALLQVLGGIAHANRFNRQLFSDDSAFVDWAQSIARHAIKAGS